MDKQTKNEEKINLRKIENEAQLGNVMNEDNELLFGCGSGSGPVQEAVAVLAAAQAAAAVAAAVVAAARDVEERALSNPVL